MNEAPTYNTLKKNPNSGKGCREQLYYPLPYVCAYLLLPS